MGGSGSWIQQLLQKRPELKARLVQIGDVVDAPGVLAVSVHLVEQSAWGPAGSACQACLHIHLSLDAVSLLCSALLCSALQLITLAPNVATWVLLNTSKAKKRPSRIGWRALACSSSSNSEGVKRWRWLERAATGSSRVSILCTCQR